MFRQIPPRELVETTVRHLGLTGLDDHRWFSKEDLRMDALDEWVPYVEPYYLPCKAKRYLHGILDPLRVLTVLKHLCKAHAIQIQTQERMVKNKKTTLYQIVSGYHDTTVRFD